MSYSVRKLASGHFFGHEEVLQNYDNRRTRVICTSRAVLYYMSQEEFASICPASELEKFRKGMAMLQLPLILQKIKKYQRVLKSKHQAILYSTQLNDHKHLTGLVGGQVIDERMKKLRPWLEPPISGELTHDFRLLKQLKKVKELAVSEQTMHLCKEDAEEEKKLMKDKL